MDTLLAPSDFQSSHHSDFDGSQFDGSPNLGSPYDTFEFSQPDSRFAHTPSYNGSYQNSPYSTISDLPPFDEDHSFGLFEPGAGINIGDDYDPAEYDAPSSSGLLTLEDNYISSENYPQVSITPPMFDQKGSAIASASSAVFDHSSPGSSNGGEDDTRSGASTASSYVQDLSNPLDFAQNFENMHMQSPGWANMQLPSGDRSSPPAGSQKPQSPPQLMIPSSPSPSHMDAQSPPTINAPAGDGMSVGPQLHIVPATPVSGGGEAAPAALFQTSASDGTQGAQPSDGSGWDQQAQHLSSPAQNQAYGGETQHEVQQTQQFLLPQAPPRSRSLSDTSLRPPVWDTAPMMSSQHQGAGVGADGNLLSSHDGRRPASAGTVNMNDVLPGPSSNLLQQTPALHQQSLRLPASAGPQQSTFTQPLSHQFNFPQSTFLTPDIAATSLRRVNSDSRGHRRLSRSEDFSYSTPTTPFNPSSMLVPPPSLAQQEFIRAAASSRQYLHPTEPVVLITRGHHRRASSGSRERTGLGGVTGWSSGASSTRASPYPSPSASPRPSYGALPDVNMPVNLSMLRRTAAGTTMMSVDMGMGTMATMDMGNPSLPSHIAKVNVTTPSTADASKKRRTQPANFQCPVPGCGSTFTRHFNLKGHLRSHAEEKPFQCKWPGCGKGFARQHDCKRHEQLHLNIRPYPCEGCKKNFARMDALNRHLRSEGGAECRKIQDEVTTASVSDGMVDVMSAPVSMKPDPDGPWQHSGSIAM